MFEAALTIIDSTDTVARENQLVSQLRRIERDRAERNQSILDVETTRLGHMWRRVLCRRHT